MSVSAPTEVLLASMRRIKLVSSQILQERFEETAAFVAAGGSTLNRDIMSLLLEARLREGEDGYKMDDKMMIEHVVRTIYFSVCKVTLLLKQINR